MQEAKLVLRQAATAQGNPWKNQQRIGVTYEGEWSAFATRTQPVLTDPEFRKTSREIYQPRLPEVVQIHTGPAGTKKVVRSGRSTAVSFNGARSGDREVLDAAALVADAYTAFLFGPSWLGERGSDLSLLDDSALDGEICRLVAGRLAPGIGNSSEDHFIAWIGSKSGLMKRFQFSLNGLDTTRGADVDVVFSDFQKAPDGSVWPRHFVERIQRPFATKAHEWRMTSLALNGQMVRMEPITD